MQSIMCDYTNLNLFPFFGRPLFEHLEEGGDGLEPYLGILPGGKYGKFFQDMLDLYYYMLMLANTNSVDECAVN